MLLSFDGWFRHEFSIQSPLHCILLLLYYNLYHTVALYNLYKIIYLKRLSYKVNKGFGARHDKWVKQFHHFPSLSKHCLQRFFSGVICVTYFLRNKHPFFKPFPVL